jgi:hypoxanthine phosphoribosyltransferase
MSLHDHIEKVIITEDEIKAKIADLGAKISEEFAGQELTLLSILHGSFLFAAGLYPFSKLLQIYSLLDLCRAIKGVHVMIDFMSVSSYGDESESQVLSRSFH